MSASTTEWGDNLPSMQVCPGGKVMGVWSLLRAVVGGVAFALTFAGTPVFAMDGIPHGGGGGSGFTPPVGYGQAFASIQTALAEESRVLRDALLGRARSPATAPDIWAAGNTGSTDFDGATPVRSLRSGAIAGWDGPGLGDWRFGIAGGWSSSEEKPGLETGRADVKTWGAGGYFAGPIGPLRLIGGGAYESHRFSVQRTDLVINPGDRYRSAFSGSTAEAFGELSAPFHRGSTYWAPFVRGTFGSVRTDGFLETGAANPMSGAAADQSFAWSEAGVRGSAPDLPFAPFLALSWRRQLDGLVSTAHLSIKGVNFTTSGARLARDSADVEGALGTPLSRRIRLDLLYDGSFASGFQANRISLRVKSQF